MLVLAVLGLAAFILGLGDIRRQRYAMEQVRVHAAAFQRRVSESGTLPLNLEPETPPQGGEKLIPLEWLDRESAGRFRGLPGPVIVVQTVPVLRTLGPDGRAVVRFDQGRFEVGWMTLKQFDEAIAAQRRSAP